MENNIIDTLNNIQRVTSTYAELFFDDHYCNKQVSKKDIAKEKTDNKDVTYDWRSPSDALIGILELKPPFTSKITRGITHEGILAIGDKVLEAKRKRFLKYLTNLLKDNDDTWQYINDQEKEIVETKVKGMYKEIFLKKSKVMQKEIDAFFEENLRDIERHMREEINIVLISVHANMISDLNENIKQRLNKEKDILEDVLNKRYKSEMKKVKHYYKLLLQDEIHRHNQLISSLLVDRNNSLKAYIRQLDFDSITSTMYIMSMERKKCQIKQFIMQNYQSDEIKEKTEKIKQKEDFIKFLREKDIPVSTINQEWEEKIKKVLQLFLKFISYSLKLLPEQSTFLLDLEKLFVLQLNEIKKKPLKVPSILLDAEKYQNIFKFEVKENKQEDCTMEPFTIVGDLSDPIPPRYGSRETLPSEVDLPIIRVQRQFVYAKCHKFEEIQKLLDSQKCKCMQMATRIPSEASNSSTSTVQTIPAVKSESESSLEPLLTEDFHRLLQCPGRKCVDWAKRAAFPYMNDYLDYSEENYKRVKTLCGKRQKIKVSSDLLKPRDIAHQDLHFAETTEPFHNVGTQYSSQETLYPVGIGCTCVEGVAASRSESHYRLNEEAIQSDRKYSMDRLLRYHPNLLSMLTDELYNFRQ